MAFPIQQGLFQFDIIDHYAVLGVPLDADFKEIRQRYLKIAYRLHPDTCRAKNNVEKERAGQLFSKLVNPAYEQLSREQSRIEYRLIISQIGKGVAQDTINTTIITEPAKKLAQVNKNVETAYQKLLQPLAVDEYLILDGVYQKIAQISELNLVYLMFSEGQTQKKLTTPAYVGAAAMATSSTQATTITQEPSKIPDVETGITSYIRRAQDSLSMGNYAQVILEIRDALKLEPNDSTSHALLGLAYLRQDQTSMARVHINQAIKANPQDPIAIESKKELDQLLNPNIEMLGSKSKNAKGQKNFWTLFNGKKK
ncbi:molecular chaperone DnaJ [Aphanothece hegewaldii CCALA 016]|uniref:Molecular chaperone DnaJ n=1 Tax=Aphanothece hegewaldii CCALA 016 TaxID=2107694 RepID=A0A2T1LRL0_9CHRO|nr:J domain-containing protein [Aphanothece hegewaldii]PSF31382.1 molecular chaperone DnaJ [Aphanothece hegewaldii CCALA 016]